MSAIAGVYRCDGRPLDQADLDGMVASLHHRGPDASGTWVSGSVGLGSAWLEVTPEPKPGTLPMVSADSAIVLAADVRLDNRYELINALRLSGSAANNVGDGELILRAYELWGEATPSRLIGDFAFAVWDGLLRKLFCARDHIGARPFYYYSSSSVFAFASEIKALLPLSEVPRCLNDERIADHIARLFDDRASTFYQHILRLPPAHSLTVSPEGARLHCYWSLDATRDIHLGSDGEYAEAFRDLFTEAVSCRLRSSQPVGVALSGGLDSSSIACTAGQLLSATGRSQLHTFSAVFPDATGSEARLMDERPYIEAILGTVDSYPHLIDGGRLSPLGDVMQTLWHQDEPILAPNLYLHRAMFDGAHQQGIRVFLDGIDGDTTVSHGLERLADLTRRGQIGAMVAEATALSRRLGGSVRSRKIIWLYGVRPLAPAPVDRLWHSFSRVRDPNRFDATAVNPRFARASGLDDRLERLRRRLPARTAREKHYRALNSGLIPLTLELADKTAAEFALEARYPFFDRRLIEFCLGLPAEQKLNNGWTRVILRRAMEGVLPDTVRWRASKANLSPNFLRRLQEGERSLLHQVVFTEADLLEAYYDIPALRGSYNRFVAQPLRRETDALVLYGAVVLALWLRGRPLEWPRGAFGGRRAYRGTVTSNREAHTAPKHHDLEGM